MTTVFQQSLAGTVLEILIEFVPTRVVRTMFYYIFGRKMFNHILAKTASCNSNFVLAEHFSNKPKVEKLQ